MTPHEKSIADLALSVLEVEGNRFGDAQHTAALRLELRCLMPYVDRPTLTSFWTVAGNGNASQRTHNLRRIFSLIKAHIGRA